jgi:hypothetical protein
MDWGDYTLDWARMDAAGHSPVTTMDHLIFLAADHSWSGAHPADKLLQKLGGETMIDGMVEIDGPKRVARLHLTCQAADEEAAEMIERAVRRYLQWTDEPDQAGGIRDATMVTYDNLPSAFRTPWRTFGPPESFSTFQGQLAREGRRLTITEGEFDHLAEGFPALVAYVRAWACTDIHYRFSEVRHDEGR